MTIRENAIIALLQENNLSTDLAKSFEIVNQDTIRFNGKQSKEIENICKEFNKIIQGFNHSCDFQDRELLRATTKNGGFIVLELVPDFDSFWCDDLQGDDLLVTLRWFTKTKAQTGIFEIYYFDEFGREKWADFWTYEFELNCNDDELIKAADSRFKFMQNIVKVAK